MRALALRPHSWFSRGKCAVYLWGEAGCSASFSHRRPRMHRRGRQEGADMGGKRRMEQRRALVIAVVTLLAVGLVWGLSSALAGSESPSPAAGKATLHLGWTNDPDNLNPFIGYESSSYEIWAITVSYTHLRAHETR